jgi:ATP-binding cassette subfamily B protein
VVFRLADEVLWSKVPLEIERICLEKLTSLDFQYYENDKFRTLLDKFRSSYEHRPRNLLNNLYWLFDSGVQFTIALIAVIHFNWIFAVVMLIITIPSIFAQAKFSVHKWWILDKQNPVRRKYHYLSRMVSHPREAKEVKLYNLSQSIRSQIKKLSLELYKEDMKLAFQRFRIDGLFSQLNSLTYIGTEFYIVVMALTKRITIGDISFYTSVVGRLQSSVSGFANSINGIFDNSLYVQTVFDVLELPDLIKKPINPHKLELTSPPSIEFRNLSFKYPDSESPIFDNFSLTISPGEKIALVGENGAGKSTLIKLLARVYDPDQGTILINGIDLKELDIPTWYEYLGVLFQDFNKYEDSFKSNIGYGKAAEEYNISDIITASVKANASDMIEKFDKKYDQVLGRLFDEGIELSGGQWQKVALARAFFRNAPILVLDEPTASIDAKAESEIFDQVEKLSRDKTVIIISHRFSTVRNADRIIVIDKGKVIESGSHEALIKQKGRYAKLFQLQAKGYQ